MNSYQVFGGVLRSELEFPELDHAVRGEPDWTLTVTTASAPDVPLGDALGEDKVDQGVMVRSFATPQGFRLVYDDTGVFDVTAGGREIRWHRPESADLEAGRLDVLGRVLALALHASGWLSLHGSAVAMAEGAVAFLAPEEKVETEDLAFILSPERESFHEPSADMGLSEATNAFQESYIRKGIRRVRGNMSEAARLLGLHRSNLYRKMRQLGMSEAEEGEEGEE